MCKSVVGISCDFRRILFNICAVSDATSSHPFYTIIPHRKSLGLHPRFSEMRSVILAELSRTDPTHARTPRNNNATITDSLSRTHGHARFLFVHPSISAPIISVCVCTFQTPTAIISSSFPSLEIPFLFSTSFFHVSFSSVAVQLVNFLAHRTRNGRRKKALRSNAAADYTLPMFLGKGRCENISVLPSPALVGLDEIRGNFFLG